MNRKQYNKLVPKNMEEVSKGIRTMAEYIVDEECTNIDGTPIIGEARNILVFDKAMDMVIVEKMTMKKHFSNGVLVGVGLTVGFYVTSKIIKKVRKNK